MRTFFNELGVDAPMTIAGRMHMIDELLKMEFYSNNPIKRLLQKLCIVKMDKLNPDELLRLL